MPDHNNPGSVNPADEAFGRGLAQNVNPVVPVAGKGLVVYGNGLYMAVSNDGLSMSSPDGISWSLIITAASNTWYSVAYGEGTFISVSASGTSNRAMSNGVLGLTV